MAGFGRLYTQNIPDSLHLDVSAKLPTNEKQSKSGENQY